MNPNSVKLLMLKLDKMIKAKDTTFTKDEMNFIVNSIEFNIKVQKMIKDMR